MPLKQEYVNLERYRLSGCMFLYDLHDGIWAYGRYPLDAASADTVPISIHLVELPASHTLKPRMENKQLDVELRCLDFSVDVAQDLLILFVETRG